DACDLFLGGAAFDFHPIDFFNLAALSNQPRQVAVVGQDDQAFGVEVEPAHRVKPSSQGCRDQVQRERSVLWIGNRREKPARLVQQEIFLLCFGQKRVDESAAHFYVIGCRIGLGSELRDYGPVHRDLAVENHLLRRPARRKSGGCDQFLESACHFAVRSKKNRDRGSTGHHVFEVFEVWQLRQIVETEMNQKVFRRAVHHWPSHNFLVTLCDDQPFVQQRLYRRRRSDTSDLKDLRDRDRLFVGDDRERLERRKREPRRRLRLEISPHVLAELRFCRDPIAARQRAKLKTALSCIELVHQLLAGGFDVRHRFAFEHRRKLLYGYRILRNKDQRFYDRLQFVNCHCVSFPAVVPARRRFDPIRRAIDSRVLRRIDCSRLHPKKPRLEKPQRKNHQLKTPQLETAGSKTPAARLRV